MPIQLESYYCVRLRSMYHPQTMTGSVTLYFTRAVCCGLHCTLILDNGSSGNFVSRDFVQRLGLKELPDARPYSISWIGQGKMVKVSTRCLVSLSTGDLLGEKVWCEVVPMSTAQIILGRPRMYDKGGRYDMRENTYAFKHKGRWVTLQPRRKKASRGHLHQHVQCNSSEPNFTQPGGIDAIKMEDQFLGRKGTRSGYRKRA